MKANLKETMTSSQAAALGLHRKSNAAMHRGSSSNGGGVSRARLSELAAAVAGNPNQTSEEMQLYFSKLKELVPFMPRNRKLSKLEIIQYVIDYICDLQLALETQPKSAAVAAAAAASNAVVSAVSLASAASTTPTSTIRQPLGVIPSNNTVCSVQEASFSLSGHSLPHHGHSLPLHDSKSAVCEQSC